MKIVTILAEGVEETEAVAVIDLLRRAKIEVTIAGLHEKEIKGSHGIVLVADTVLDAVDKTEFDGIFLPGGGEGVHRLAADQRVLELVKYFYKHEKWVAALCAAPYVLYKASILSGRQFTIYPSWSAKVEDGVYVNQAVVVDGKIVTGRAFGAAIDLGLTLVELLVNVDAREALREAVVYDK